MILVTGAKGVVGQCLTAKLAADNVRFLAVSRNIASSQSEVQWDLTMPPRQDVLGQLQGVKTLIHCAPIWLLPQHLPNLQRAGIERLVVFSSTSVISKQESSNQAEQTLVTQLGDSEQQLSEFCAGHSMFLTILRPSMIYGYGRDQNISHIASFIKRFGFFVLVGKGSGLRQPVHADDLVDACLSIVDNPATFGKAYNLAGAEVLSYRAMVERIFVGLNKPKRILNVPLFLFRPALSLAAKLTPFSYTPEMADRMMQNLNYDYGAASVDFNYHPSAFLSHAERDLV